MDRTRNHDAENSADPLPRARGRVREGAARFRPLGARNLDMARRLRRDMTDAERELWQALRAHRFLGLPIRRQARVGTYVVDFLCAAKRLVIEVDGGQHMEADGRARDEERTRALELAGYRVVRYSNLDVLTNIDGVLQNLASVLVESPLPTLPRARGRAERRALP